MRELTLAEKCKFASLDYLFILSFFYAMIHKRSGSNEKEIELESPFLSRLIDLLSFKRDLRILWSRNTVSL
ncbi:predicted protein [Enterococcus casseliflavus EC30]|nr:predicted protein [Enterococcus casseliflavus EC30]EEV34623.1 predicted protein [Enterococcus casseliflavus EC10]